MSWDASTYVNSRFEMDSNFEVGGIVVEFSVQIESISLGVLGIEYSAQL